MFRSLRLRTLSPVEGRLRWRARRGVVESMREMCGGPWLFTVVLRGAIVVTPNGRLSLPLLLLVVYRVAVNRLEVRPGSHPRLTPVANSGGPARVGDTRPGVSS